MHRYRFDPRRFFADERGQTPTEYLMIGGLTAVTIIIIVLALYPELRGGGRNVADCVNAAMTLTTCSDTAPAPAPAPTTSSAPAPKPTTSQPPATQPGPRPGVTKKPAVPGNGPPPIGGMLTSVIAPRIQITQPGVNLRVGDGLDTQAEIQAWNDMIQQQQAANPGAGAILTVSPPKSMDFRFTVTQAQIDFARQYNNGVVYISFQANGVDLGTTTLSGPAAPGVVMLDGRVVGAPQNGANAIAVDINALAPGDHTLTVAIGQNTSGVGDDFNFSDVEVMFGR